MARVPIIHVGDTLIATVLEDLNDRDALALHESLGERLEQTGVRGVILDLTAVDTVDSFLGRMLNDLAMHTQLMGAHTVIVGIQPAVAITLVELGLQLSGVRTALNPVKGRLLLRRLLAQDNKRRRDDWR